MSLVWHVFIINASFLPKPQSYVCDGYVANDNKKEELEALRKLLDHAQTADESISTTRSGKIIRPPPKLLTSIEEYVVSAIIRLFVRTI